MKPPALFVSLTLSFWLGIHALRSYVPAAVWNLADELPLSLKPVLAVATQLLGVAAVLIVVKWRRRALKPLAIAFALVSFTRQVLVADDHIGPWLALLSWALWLCAMAALADEVAAQDAESLIAPALATALAFQLGLQSAWHGLDLPAVRGPLAVAAAAVLALAFAASVLAVRPPALPRPHASLAWLLLGPALFMEATLIGNVGRIAEITGFALPTTAILMQATLLVAVIVALHITNFAVRIILIAAGFIAVFGIPGLRGVAALIVLVVQIITICALREAADRRIRLSGAVSFAIGSAVLFALIFGFYNLYELPVLWVLSYAVLAVAAGLAQRNGVVPDRYIAAAFPLATVLALFYFVPPPASRAADARDGITILSYNIHHGFDDAGMPGMQRIAREIANMNPDLVALQEIGRGWTLVGGNDLVAYLQWRLPEHRIHFTATNGQLWGNAVMSRLPVIAATGGSFSAEPGILKYGWSGVIVSYDDRPFPFYSVHLTADLEGSNGDPRTVQASELLRVTSSGSAQLIAGDFNAHPEDEPIQLLTTKFHDLGSAAGLGRLSTWPAGRPNERIDYVFARGFTVRSGSIPRTLASDHLPVLLHVQPERR